MGYINLDGGFGALRLVQHLAIPLYDKQVCITKRKG